MASERTGTSVLSQREAEFFQQASEDKRGPGRSFGKEHRPTDTLRAVTGDAGGGLSLGAWPWKLRMRRTRSVELLRLQ